MPSLTFRETGHYALYIDKNVIHRGKNVIIKRIVWIAINIACTCGIVILLFDNWVVSGWVSWIIKGIVMVLTSSSVTLITSLLFFKDDMKKTYRVTQRMIPRKRNIFLTGSTDAHSPTIFRR